MSGDSSVDERIKERFKKIWNDPVWSKVISALILITPPSIVTFFLWVGIKWIVILLIIALWGFLTWATKSRKKLSSILTPDNSSEHTIPRFSRRWQRNIFYVTILSTGAAILGFGIIEYIERTSPIKTTILIADFQGPDQKHAVTPTIINRMKRATGEFPDVKIKAYSQIIAEGIEKEEIKRIGLENKADVIVWGFYDESLRGTVHIEQIRETCSCSLGTQEMDFNAKFAEGQSISVQEILSGDMTILALLLVGVARYDVEDYDGAITRLTKALSQLQSPQADETVTDVKFYLGKSLYGKGKYSDAAIQFREVASKRSSSSYPLNWLGAALISTEQYVEAEIVIQKELELIKRNPTQTTTETASPLNNLAVVYKSQGKFAEAEILYKQVLEIRRKTLPAGHLDIATSVNNLGALYQVQERYAEAESLFREALSIRQKNSEEERAENATTLNNLAQLLQAQGKYAEAEPLFKRALEIREEKLGDSHPDTAVTLDDLAKVYHSQRKYVEAERLFKKALEIRKTKLGDEHPDTVTTLNNLASLYQDVNKFAEAELLFKQVLEIGEKSPRKDEYGDAITRNNLASLYQAQYKYEEAEKLYKQALQVLMLPKYAESVNTASTLNNLASLYQAQGRVAEAAPLRRQAAEIRSRKFNQK